MENFEFWHLVLKYLSKICPDKKSWIDFFFTNRKAFVIGTFHISQVWISLFLKNGPNFCRLAIAFQKISKDPLKYYPFRQKSSIWSFLSWTWNPPTSIAILKNQSLYFKSVNYSDPKKSWNMSSLESCNKKEKFFFIYFLS